MYIVDIRDWIPPSVNSLLKLHWSKRGKIKRNVVDLMALECLSIPRAKGRRRVSVTIMAKKNLPDPDNILKCLLDALVQTAMIVDDSSEFYELGSVQIKKGNPIGTTIFLEDL